MSPRQLRQMRVSRLPSRLCPRGKVRDIVIVGNEPEWYGWLFLQSHQKCFGLRYRQSILRSLRQNAHESQFGNRAGEYFVACSVLDPQHPPGNTFMKLMFKKAERHECVYIEKISHGRSDRIS